MAGKKGQGQVPKKIIEKLKDLFLDGALVVPHHSHRAGRLDDPAQARNLTAYPEDLELVPLSGSEAVFQFHGEQ